MADQNLNQSSPGVLNQGNPPSLSPPLTPAPSTPSTASGAPATQTTSDGAASSSVSPTANSGPSPGVLGAAANAAPPQPVGISTSECCGEGGGGSTTITNPTVGLLVYSQATRPAAATFPITGGSATAILNTTTKQINVSDGANWYDALGNLV